LDFLGETMRSVEHLLVPGTIAFWAAMLSILAAFLSAAITLIVLVRLPADAFSAHARSAHTPRRSLRRLLLHIARNGAGWILVGAGILLSIPGVPGQGLLTLLLGLLLVDFPGRVRLLRRLLGRQKIRHLVDRLRVRFGRPPMMWDVHG
jgi:hypothetical protein